MSISGFLLVIVTGFLLGLSGVMIFKKISLRYGILNQKGMPLVGGAVTVLVFTILSAVFVYPVFTRELKGLIISSLLMFVFGVIDDWHELSVPAKFTAQIIATAVMMAFGIKAQIVYIGNAFNAAVTFLWVIGITNAFNHLDVSDGLAAGAAVMVSASLFIVASINNDVSAALLSLVLVASLLACLIYNFPPAKIYMGNSGSHFLGFLIAGIALAISYAPLHRKIALLSPVVILGLPIFDTAFLILARLLKRKMPFNKSDDHLALRFIAGGYSKKKTLLAMLVLCFLFCLFGVLLSQVSNIAGAFLLLGMAVIIMIFLRKLRSMKQRQSAAYG
ncbi:MAG: MraY family glycosyltransferase [Candidatus Omnitrophota bacterium]